MPGEPILELTNATVVKDDRPIIDGLDLTIRAGEHTAILGPNGAGKSLLVSLITHTERPLARTKPNGHPPIKVFGQETWNVSELRTQLGIVSADLHHRFLIGNSEGRITGEAAVLSAFLASHGLLRYGSITDVMRARATEALESVGASHLARRTLDRMSSGEARRVLLARVLVTSPRALILDEPTTGLDLVARHDFMEQVRRIAKKATLILITHHTEEIVPEIDRVILMREGRCVADGPKQVVLKPEHLSETFGVPILLQESDGYYYARPSTGL